MIGQHVTRLILDGFSSTEPANALPRPVNWSGSNTTNLNAEELWLTPPFQWSSQKVKQKGTKRANFEIIGVEV